MCKRGETMSKKVFISADIEGVNNVLTWDETELDKPEYPRYRKLMTQEVKAACEAAHNLGYEVFVKDAHDSARNLLIEDLPEYVTLHRGWQGCPASMMAGLDESFSAVIYIGYHSAANTNGNPLSHTMTTRVNHIKINGKISSEFLMNSYYASYKKVPIAFLSGDEALTKAVKEENDNIEVVATKKGVGNAIMSKHPDKVYKEIYDGVTKALSKDLKNNLVMLPQSFDIDIEFKNHQEAYSKSFFPGCKYVNPNRLLYSSDDYYECAVMFKFVV